MRIRWMAAGLGVSLTALAPAQAPEGLTERQAEAKALEARLPAPKVQPKTSFDLSPVRQERFQKLLPKAWKTLSQREPLQILVLGDAGSTAVRQEDGADAGGFAGGFARELAAQFFYTGGVQASGSASKLLGPAISVRDLTRDGSVLEAASILGSTARQQPVQLVLLCYGRQDSGLAPATFARAVTAALDAVRELGAEAVLCSPWLPAAEASETVWGQSRPLAEVLRETAEAEGVLFADLGDLTRLLPVPEANNQEPGPVFERLEQAYRSFFHAETAGGFTPKAGLQAKLGGAIYRTLLDGPSTARWKLGEATAQWQADGRLRMTCPVQNPGDQPLHLTSLPMPAAGWTPLEATTQVDLEPGAQKEISVTWTPPKDLAPQEAWFRLPLLLTAGAEARLECPQVAPRPVAITWSLETLFNQETAFSAGCQVVNTSPAAWEGQWQAEFNGAKAEGKLTLAAGAGAALDLRFDLPADGPPVQVLPLQLTVRGSGGFEQRVQRSVRLSRNLGLGQPVVLSPHAPAAGEVKLQAAARRGSLLLSCDLSSADLLQAVATGVGPAWQLEVHLDARSYGKRLEQGATAALRATGAAVSGPGTVHEVVPWAFGNGYAAGFDPKAFQAELASGPAGTPQIRFTLPRSYLYLHEWALDNGNSQLGLQLRLTLNTAQGPATWTLAPTAKPAADVESLTVLELTEKPTRRVTVDIH